ncbi:MAG: hypothetical protein IAE87_13705 [Rhodobacteraceae bacterium]|jgi:hypothetical protein|nr:hypothetical protein [Paracoccaceae bacterium]
MSIVVIVRIPNVDIDKVREAAVTHKELHEQLRNALNRYGCLSHKRIYNTELREIMDIDEWESDEGMRAFLKEMGPTIAQLAAIRGTGKPTDSIWQNY